MAQPLTSPVAARYLPLGAYSQQHADIYATRNNAAALAQLQQSSVAVYAEQRFALSKLNSYAFSGGMVTKNGAIAFHGSYFGFNLFSQNQLSLAYGMKLSKKADAGLQFNYYSLRQGAGYGNASSFNAAAGAVFHLSDQVHAGIHIYNPVGSKWSKAAEEKIPAQYTLGIGYEVSETLYLGSEIVKEENRPVSINAGIQYQFNKQFFSRAGISTGTSSYFGSVGFQATAFRVDIAAAYQVPLGISPGILILFYLSKKRATEEE